MPRLFLFAVCAFLAACAGDPEPPPAAESGPPAADAPEAGPELLPHPVAVRGLYLGAIYDSAAAVISHEEIPGVMGAMRMQLRVADASELRELHEGDKIRFLLADPAGAGYQVSRIEKLPANTELALAEYGPEGVPPEASLPDTAGSAP